MFNWMSWLCLIKINQRILSCKVGQIVLFRNLFKNRVPVTTVVLLLITLVLLGVLYSQTLRECVF